MTEQQQAALEALVSRELTQDEITQIDGWLESRRDDLIAGVLSIGRTRPVETEVGVGTVLALLRGVGAGGGAFLDTLEAVGESDRDVHWTMVLIREGKLRIDMAPVRAGMEALALAVPGLAAGIDILLELGFGPDPIKRDSVSDALNAVVEA